MEEDGNEKNSFLEQVNRDYKLSNEHGYPVIDVPSSLNGAYMKKMIWPRVNFPREVHRWNLPEEILSYLISFDSHSKWMTTEQLDKPPSGSMWLFNKNDANKTHYKCDGYDWKTRLSCKSVREDRTKMKVCGHTLVYAVYTHRESNSFFHRRFYWLIKNPSIVIVHYLDTSQRKASTAATVKKYFEQGSSYIDASPSNSLLLTVSDEDLCQYLSSSPPCSSSANARSSNGDIPSLLSSLSQNIKDIAHKLTEQNEPVSTATLVTCIQKTLFTNSIPDTPTNDSDSLITKRQQLISTLLHHQKTMRLLKATSTPQLLLPKGTHLHVPCPVTCILTTPTTPELPIIDKPHPLNNLPTHNNEEVDDFIKLLHPPSLDGVRSLLPEPLDIDHFPSHSLTTPTNDTVDITADFAHSLLTMRPLADAEKLQHSLHTSVADGIEGCGHIDGHGHDEEMKEDDFLTDEFLNHFLDELNTGRAPPIATPTSTPTQLHVNGQSVLSSDHTPLSIDLDPESVRLLTELYKEEITPSIAPPLSPVSQYMASLNECQETLEQSTSGYHDNGYHSDLGYQENGFHDNSYYMNDPSLLLSVNEPHSQTNDAFQFANSLLQQPPLTNHTPSSSHASSLSPAHMQPLEEYRSPVHSPSSPASLSSLSTGGSEPPLVAELCELMSESPNVQQTDFSHLSLSGPEQQELLQASRVIQKTLRRCKERPNSMVTLKEKNAALLIERCYQRYREIKDRRDQAARCIQTQYRLYRRRNDELQRAALFIQQMYRYQRRRRCDMSSLATHSQGGQYS